MKTIIEKFISIEKELAEEKGSFVLFALFEREDALLDKQDVVISASWLGKNKKKPLRLIVDKINSKLTSEELINLSMVVLLEPTDNLVKDVNDFIHIEHGKAELVDCTFNGISIKHACIITSKRPANQQGFEDEELTTGLSVQNSG